VYIPEAGGAIDGIQLHALDFELSGAARPVAEKNACKTRKQHGQ
jgi:hypothetical protein